MARSLKFDEKFRLVGTCPECGGPIFVSLVALEDVAHVRCCSLSCKYLNQGHERFAREGEAVP